MPGSITSTNMAAPSTPSSGRSEVYTDSTSKNLCSKNDAGTVNHGVQTLSAVVGSYVTAISDAGVAALTALGKSDLDQMSIHGADIPSAGTTNLETATGWVVDVTGTTGITAITLSEGHVRIVRFTGALTLTNGASLVLPGGANITTVAGDYAMFAGYAAGVVRCVHYQPTTMTGTGGGVLSVSPTFTGTPLTPTAATDTNTTQIASTAYVIQQEVAILAAYRTLMQAAASITAGVVAGTYALSNGDAAAVSGTGTLYPLAVIQIVAADYPTVSGKAAKLRCRFQLYTNDVAPTGNFTLGLYPITRPGTSGGAGVAIYTLGTVVSGSNGATFSSPAADLLGTAVGSDFALPSDGPYVLGVVTTGTIAASAHVHMNAQLQIRNA